MDIKLKNSEGFERVFTPGFSWGIFLFGFIYAIIRKYVYLFVLLLIASLIVLGKRFPLQMMFWVNLGGAFLSAWLNAYELKKEGYKPVSQEGEKIFSKYNIPFYKHILNLVGVVILCLPLFIPAQPNKTLKLCKEYFENGKGASWLAVFDLEIKNLHIKNAKCIFEVNGEERSCIPSRNSKGQIDCQ